MLGDLGVVLARLGRRLRLGRHAVVRLEGQLARRPRRVERELIRPLHRLFVPRAAIDDLARLDLDACYVTALVNQRFICARPDEASLAVLGAAVNFVASVPARAAHLGHHVALLRLDGSSGFGIVLGRRRVLPVGQRRLWPLRRRCERGALHLLVPVHDVHVVLEACLRHQRRVRAWAWRGLAVDKVFAHLVLGRDRRRVGQAQLAFARAAERTLPFFVGLLEGPLGFRREAANLDDIVLTRVAARFFPLAIGYLRPVRMRLEG